MSAPTAVCDQCSFRKIRCLPGLSNPSKCQACVKSQLDCTRERHIRRIGRSARLDLLRAQQRAPDPGAGDSAFALGPHATSSQTAATSTTAPVSTDRDGGAKPNSVIGAAAMYNDPFDRTAAFDSDPSIGVAVAGSSAHVALSTHADSFSLQNGISSSDFTSQLNPLLTDMPEFDLEALLEGFPNSSMTWGDAAPLGAFTWAPQMSSTVANNMPSWNIGPLEDLWTDRTQQIPNAGISDNEIQSPGLSQPRISPSTLDLYYDRLYPMAPVLSRARLENQLHNEPIMRSASLPSLLWSMCLIIEMIDCTHADTGDEAKPFALADARMRREFPDFPIPPPPRCDSREVIDVYTCMSSFHLFVAWTMIGRRRLAWLRLQEAISLAQSLDVTPLDIDGSHTANDRKERLFLFWILFITERSTVILQQRESLVEASVRLSDREFGYASLQQSGLASSDLAPFPVTHLKVFSLIKSHLLSCWRNACGTGCTLWPAAEGVRVQDSLSLEFQAAIGVLHGSPASTIELSGTGSGGNIELNVILTIAWFRDRVWNICLRHRHITSKGPDCLRHSFIQDNLSELRKVFAICKISTADVGAVDYACKLFDMAVTATLVMQSIKYDGQVTAKTVRDELNAGLLANAHWILGILLSLGPQRASLASELIKSIARISD